MKIKEQEPMRNHTTWRIGGPADLLVQPESVEELQEAIQMAEQSDTPYYVIGGGSNLLVADEGIAGTVIQLGGSLTGLQITDKNIIAEAGVPLPVLARKAAEYGLSGLEFAAGIPGSVGGAVVMNAGAYQGQISDVIRQVVCCDASGQLVTLDAESCEFSYRNSRFKKNRDLIIVSVKMELTPGDKEKIQEQMKKNTASRKEKQPVEYPNAGSIFKNPAGDAAGRLIELAGAKGWRQGDAMVSEKHSNFIVNLGSATSEDVLQLVNRVKQAVYSKTGVLLEEEILFLGRENSER
ncbi:MAG: UDP-N-acetylmuramate dehydrogenase [Peptococcaceae bacterium]|nr:UDP-N-acetylmuramate dehydrogenase [Peptococcaceae bacterium]